MIDSLYLLKSVKPRLGMFVSAETFPEVCAFVSGYDLATGGGALAGFREWLIVLADGGNNLSWSRLVLRASFPEHPAISPESVPEKLQAVAIDKFFDLIDLFSRVRDEQGLRWIYLNYENWLRVQDWYEPNCHPG